MINIRKLKNKLLPRISQKQELCNSLPEGSKSIGKLKPTNIKTSSSVVAVLFASLVLVACSSGGSGGGPSNPGNLGSAANNDYDFKIAEAITRAAPNPNSIIARVRLNENNIKAAVARTLGRGSDQISQITLISSGTGDYELDVEFATLAGNAAAALYYEVDFDPNNPMIVAITPKAAPSGSLFTQGDIFNLVPNLSFDLVVNVPAAANGRGEKITSTFRVGLASATDSQFDEADPFNFNPRALLQPRVGSVMGNLTSDIEVRINENNPFNGAFTAISPNGAGTSNILSAFGLSFKNLDRTVYLGLEDLSGGDCKSGEIYLDASGYVVRAADIFNFEDADDYPSALPDCRLMISYDGVNYDPVGVPLTAATQTSLGAAQRLGTTATATGTKGCPSGLTDCYYADLDIQVQDLNERPSVQLISGGNAVTAFTGSSEGVGPLPEYTTAAVVASGALASGADIESMMLRIFDQDLIHPRNPSSGHYSILLGGTSISVSPGHGHGKFRLVNTSLPTYSSTITAGDIALEVNKSRLDFEDFVRGNQLDADGKAIYTIRVSVVDPQGLSATESFTYEVTDVTYNPLFVNATNPRQTISSGDFQLDLKSAIQTGTGDPRPIYVLPGIHTYQNNLANIGRIAAVNPETGTDNELEYFLAATNARVSTSTGFSLVRGNRNLGRDLVIARADLLPNDRGSVTSFNAIGAAYKTAQTTAVYTDPQFSIIVDSSQYSNLANLPGRASTDVYFKDNSVVAMLAERVASGTAVNFTDELSTPGVSQMTDVLSFNVERPSQNIDDEPRYGFVPANLLGSVNGFISQVAGSQAYVVGAGNNLFNINPESGQITTRTDADNIVFASPGYYVLPVYVRDAASHTQANGEFTNRDLGSVDIALVTLFIEDDNAAPAIVSTAPARQNEMPGNTSSPLEVKITVPETAGSQGTQVGDRIFSFVVSDDNNRYGGEDNLGTTFEMAAGISGSPSPTLLDRYLNVTFRASDNQEQLIADVTLKAELDYEDSTVLTAFVPANQGKFIVKITDAGEYELNSGTLEAEAKSSVTNPEDIQLQVNMRVTDIAEAPELEVDGSLATLTISETAALNTRVQNGNSDLVINIENPRALAAAPAAGAKYQFNTSGGFNYVLTGDLANILQVEQDLAATTTTSTDPVPLVLTVRDRDALENVGDGRTFPLTIRMTTPNGLSSNTISLNVMVEDAGQTPTLDPTDFTPLNVSEDNAPNGVSGYVIPWPQGMMLTPDSVTDDWDDNILTGSGVRAAFDIGFRLENQAVANAANLFGSRDFKPLGLRRNTQNNQWELYVADGNFIEAVLFGDITADIVAYDTLRDAASAMLASASITVTVDAASGGKNLVYRGAGNAADASTYTASYTQNAFIDAPRRFNPVVYNYTDPRVAAGTIRAGSFVLTPGTGSRPGMVFTASVAGGSDTLDGNFISRSISATPDFENAATGTAGAGNLDFVAGTALPDTRITPDLAQINLNANTNLTDTSSVRIFRAENGALVDASAEFNRYFTLNIVNTATASTQLQIAQRVISRPGSPGLGGLAGPATNYLALDSLPLFQGAEDQHNFTYYLRAYSGGTVASNNARFHALAQFNLLVKAPANNPASITFPVPVLSRDTATNKVATRSSDFSYTRPELVFTPTRAFSENLGVLGLSNAQETAEPITDSEFKLAYTNLGNENDLLAYNFALQLTNAAGEQVDFLVWQGQNPAPTGTGWVRNYLQLNRPLQADELGEYNVAWSVTDETGDPVAELAGSFILLAYDATLNPVLAEGEEAYFADFVSAVANGQPLEIINDIVGYSAIEVKAGTEISLDFSIIDGDPQDGVPHAPEASNILRPTGFAWQGLSKLPDYSDYSCANVIKDLAITNYVALPADPAQSIAKVSFTALVDSANGGCWLSFIDGEDGAFFDRTLIISIQP